MNNKAFNKGEERYKERDYEGAVIEFTLALESDPGNPEIIYQRAMSYYHLQKKSLALMDMDSAVEMQPNYSFRFASRAFMRDAFGDVIGAIADYKRAIELDPEDAISYNNLGILEDKMGRRSVSQGYYNKADNLMETNPRPIDTSMDGFGATINYDRATEKQESNNGTPESKSLWVEIKKVFTSKDGFSEFIQFVKSGFKINN